MYLDATGALNDLNSALKQLIDPNSRFELQTLEELLLRRYELLVYQKFYYASK